MQLENKYTLSLAMQELDDSGYRSVVVTICYELEQLGFYSMSESIFLNDYTVNDIVIDLVKARRDNTEEEFSTTEYNYACQLIDILISINNLSNLPITK